MLSRRRAVLALASAAILAGTPASSAAAAGGDDARAFLAGVAEEVTQILRDKGQTLDARRSKLGSIFVRVFDVPNMAQFAIGRGWDAASEEQRRRYVPLFERYVVAIYADKFASYSGETAELLGTRNAADGQIVVATRIKRANDMAPITADYRLRAGDGGFKIVDVVVERMSPLVTKRLSSLRHHPRGP
jgi:phospholipid transport system substrate-binding protein